MFSLFRFLVFSFSLLSDAYDIFIDGRSPDTYLSPDFNKIFNNSFYFNGSFDGNLNSTSILTQSNIIHKNTSEINNSTGEDVTELVIMAVTSIILGLVILITVIGKYRSPTEHIDRTEI